MIDLSHEPLRVLFLVQGEGRGHMTQALALAPMLKRAGAEVVGALVGMGPNRELPAFFLDEIGCPVRRYDEPNFTFDAQSKGIRYGQTLLDNARRLPALTRSLRAIQDAVDTWKPHVIVNFFALMGGFYGGMVRKRPPVVAVGHQYMFHHPVYPFPPGTALQTTLARRYTALTSWGASRRMALSFYDAAPMEALEPAPPLLRDRLREVSVGDDGFLLVYLLNSGYAEDVMAWSRTHPDVPLHVFWDRPGAPQEEQVSPSLTLHRLSGEKFLQKMGRCTGLVCTAGFESVCEALYLGKPALMVPVQGHFEQQCNARDAQLLGAGLGHDRFDLSALLHLADTYTPVPGFRAWADEAESRFVSTLFEVSGRNMLQKHSI